MGIRRWGMLAIALALAGCGAVRAPMTMGSPQDLAALARKKPLPPRQDLPSPEAAFIKAVAAHGETLTPDQLDVIQHERQLVPNGQWAPRPADNLTAEQNLQVHFLKHGNQFHPSPSTPEEYMAWGNDAANGKHGEVKFVFDLKSFANGYQSHVMRWVKTTLDFTAFRPDGCETTYYKDIPSDDRYVEVPIW